MSFCTMFLSQKRYNTLSICFYVSLLLVASTSVAMAQTNGATGEVTGASSILENAIEVSRKSEAGLNALWEFTFTDNFSPAYRATGVFATEFMVIPFFWLVIPMARAFVYTKYDEIFRHIAWILVVMMLTVNSYGLTAKLAYGTRGWINGATLSILEVQLGEVTMRDALNDVLLTEQAKAVIQAKLAECEAKESEEQIDCFVEGANKALEDIRAAERSVGLSGLRRLEERLQGIIEASIRDGLTLDDLNPNSDFLKFFYVSAGQALAQQLMKGFQNAMLTMMDVGYFLTALLGPVAVAASLAPLKPRILLIWATGIISFGLMRMAYNILVGAIATVALFGNNSDTGSTGLLIGMAVFSPLLAMAMASWGGARIVHAMVGGATAVVAMIPVPIPRGR